MPPVPCYRDDSTPSPTRSRRYEGHSSADCWSVAGVHQSLGDIHRFDTGAFLEFTKIQDELMSHQSGVPLVQNGVMLFQPLGHVVGIEDGHLCGFCQSVTTHQGDVHPGNRKDIRTAERGCRDRTDGLRPTKLDHGMSW